MSLSVNRYEKKKTEHGINPIANYRSRAQKKRLPVFPLMSNLSERVQNGALFEMEITESPTCNDCQQGRVADNFRPYTGL